MTDTQILIICPRCGGHKIIDELPLSETSMKVYDPIETPEEIIIHEFTCLECGEAFTMQEKKKRGS